MIYFFIYFYLLFCAIWYDAYGNSKYFKFNYIALLLIFILVSGLRYRLGQDTVAYMKSFEYEIIPLKDLHWVDIFESSNQPLWVLLNSFCKTYGGFVLLQLLISSFLHITVFVFIYRSCSKPFTAVLLYYLLSYIYFSMEILRESLAISCFLFALLQLNKGSIIKYYVWIIFAFLFHFFACVLFLVPFIITDKISTKLKFCFLIFLFVGAYLFRDQLILNFAMIFPEAIGIKLLSYSSNPEFFEGGLNIIGITFKFIFPSFIIIYALCKKGNDIFYLKANIWENCSILYAFFLFSTLFVPIMERFSNYFFVVSAILFASCIYKVRMTPHSNAIATFVISILVLSYQINYMVSVDPNAKVPTYVKYYPYTSVFNKIETDERALFNSYWSGY